MEVIVNRCSTETAIWNVYRVLMQKYGTDIADSDIAPLSWYIWSGRASVDFIRLLIAAKPFMVARKLHLGGSYDSAIERVKTYIGYND